MARRDGVFTTMTTEGGLLPADLLARIAQNDVGLKGLKPADYHLNANERLGEMINRSWNRATGAWAAFQESLGRLGPEDLATTVTRERWLLVLFEELGFGRLQPARALSVDGRQFPISHEWGGRVALHLVGARVDLDRRTSGVVGAARSSPHSLVQELLNASPDHLWGVATNGRELRLLRDNASVTRQAYVSFDLAAMMEGQVYPDFVLLWLLLHESRFEGDHPVDCWLERWTKEAEAEGSRALEQLREGVEAAITAFGQGFLAHSSNGALRNALRTGALDTQDYYRQLLRLVYRLLFLFVAEDRNLLLSPQASPAARDRYLRFYSVDRMRRLAERRRGTLHSDLYQALKVVMRALDDTGSEPLGLPALGSYLWRPDAIAFLGAADISNRSLLTGISALAFHVEHRKSRPTDFRNLGSEELGSVYESLLELHPRINLEAVTFALATAAGHERKSTGSYYTPTGLIAALLDSTLDPVLDRATKANEREASLLSLRVLDPACGSGHFLIAAAHRLAKRLGAIRTGDDEPSPGATRSALRDVISHCIYGVDKNEMAVELCKVSLWMEALDPGRPLSFIDHHIVCGNSLIGCIPGLVDAGIPDDAYKVVTNDDKATVMSSKRRNQEEASGQDWLGLDFDGSTAAKGFREGIRELDRLPDQSIGSVRQKERLFVEIRESLTWQRERLAADLWCAAFVGPKTPDRPMITNSSIRRALAGESLSSGEATLVADVAGEYGFLHWHLAFPGVFGSLAPAASDDGPRIGFDVVLGNPPWEQIQLDAREYFAESRPDIAGQANLAARERALASLAREDPATHDAYLQAKRANEALQHFVHNSGRFPLTSTGRLNSAPLFAELATTLTHVEGQAGMVLPTGIFTDSFNRHFVNWIVSTGRLRSLYDFENSVPLFPGVHRSQKFGLATLGGPVAGSNPSIDFVFYARQPEDLSDPDRRYALTASDLQTVSPTSGTIPVFRSNWEAETVKGVYERLPILRGGTDTAEVRWGAKGLLMFMMNTASHLFRTRDQLEKDNWELRGNTFCRGEDQYLPLFEGKMIDLYDHRAAHVVVNIAARARQGQPLALSVEEHRSCDVEAIPRYWVPEAEVTARLGAFGAENWLLAVADVTGATNERTVIATPLARVGVGHSALVLTVGPEHAGLRPYLASNLSSFALDFVARTKVGGNHLSQFILDQLPVVVPGRYLEPAPWDEGISLGDWIKPRILELCYVSWSLRGFAKELDFEGDPFVWDPKRRPLLQADLDAAYMLLYSFGRQDVDRIMDTFMVLKRRDIAATGEFATKLRVLAAYDRLSADSRSVPETGVVSRTVVEKLPAPDAAPRHLDVDIRS